MGILPCLVALAVLAPAGPTTGEDRSPGAERDSHRVVFFVGGSPAHGLHLHVDVQQCEPEATPPRFRFVMRSQVAVGLSRGVGLVGDGSIERPWTALVPGRAFGLMLQFGATPDYWAIPPATDAPEVAGD